MFKIDEKGFDEGVTEAEQFSSGGNYYSDGTYYGGRRDLFLSKGGNSFKLTAGDYFLIADVQWD